MSVVVGWHGGTSHTWERNQAGEASTEKNRNIMIYINTLKGVFRDCFKIHWKKKIYSHSVSSLILSVLPVSIHLVLWAAHDQEARQDVDEHSPHPRRHGVCLGRAEVYVQHHHRHTYAAGRGGGGDGAHLLANYLSIYPYIPSLDVLILSISFFSFRHNSVLLFHVPYLFIFFIY